MFSLQKRRSLKSIIHAPISAIKNNKIYPKQAESDNKDKTRNQLNWKHKTVEENSKISCWFFGKIHKIDKFLTRLSKKRIEKTQINIRNEIGVIIIDPMCIKMIVKRYYEQFLAHKLDSLDEIYQLHENNLCFHGCFFISSLLLCVLCLSKFLFF